MICPNCKNKKLEEIRFYGNQIDNCTNCLGFWFDQDELRKAKDKKDEYIRWIDVDLFNEDVRDLDIGKSKKKCPKCKILLYEVNYFKKNGENIRVDVCKKCYGIWLDKGEFGKIIQKLKEVGDYEILNNYAKNLKQEFKEIFTGPENFKSELLDFLIVLKLFRYKFLIENKNFSNLIYKIINLLPK